MPDNYYPKQSLDTAIQRGLKRPTDTPGRQKVRMGQDPMSRQREDYSIRVAQESGRKMQSPVTGGAISDRMDEDRAASRRPSRRRRGGGRR